jgi:hypothetical protein
MNHPANGSGFRAPLRWLERHGFAIFFFVMGAVVAFVVAPGTARASLQIGAAPEMDAVAYDAAPPGTWAVVTGRLRDNEVFSGGFVAAGRTQWMVAEGASDGEWVSMGQYVPGLTVVVEGGTISTTRGIHTVLSGRMHEGTTLPEGAGPSGKDPVAGTVRIRGFHNGDVVTVAGEKTATGELQPVEIYGGSRDEMIMEHQRPAWIWFTIGVLLMIGAVVAGVWFDRRRRLQYRRSHT